MSKKIILLAALIVIVAAFVIVPHMARAATFTVTNGGDSGAGSLRQAVLDANGTAGADTITFNGVATVTLNSAISITDAVTISGPGAGSLTISGNNATQVFVNSANGVTISGVTIANARAGDGAAILNNAGGNLTIQDSVFTNNVSTSGYGGAIINGYTGGSASLTVQNSTFTNNTGAFYGGAIANYNGTVGITGSLFSGNSAAANGNDVYNRLGNTDIGGSCIADPTAVMNAEVVGGSGTANNNWWGTSAGPNNGGGSTNMTVNPGAWLAAAPACGAGTGGGSGAAGGAGGPPDDRINWQHGDSYAIFYARWDEHGDPALHVYCVNEQAQGILKLIVTQEMLDKYPEFPDKPAHNRELFHSSVCRTPFFFYILTTGEYQINVGPDWEGKTDVIIFTGMPPGHVYFYSYDVFNPIQWQ